LVTSGADDVVVTAPVLTAHETVPDVDTEYELNGVERPKVERPLIVVEPLENRDDELVTVML